MPEEPLGFQMAPPNGWPDTLWTSDNSTANPTTQKTGLPALSSEGPRAHPTSTPHRQRPYSTKSTPSRDQGRNAGSNSTIQPINSSTSQASTSPTIPISSNSQLSLQEQPSHHKASSPFPKPSSASASLLKTSERRSSYSSLHQAPNVSSTPETSDLRGEDSQRRDSPTEPSPSHQQPSLPAPHPTDSQRSTTSSSQKSTTTRSTKTSTRSSSKSSTSVTTPLIFPVGHSLAAFAMSSLRSFSAPVSTSLLGETPRDSVSYTVSHSPKSSARPTTLRGTSSEDSPTTARPSPSPTRSETSSTQYPIATAESGPTGPTEVDLPSNSSTTVRTIDTDRRGTQVTTHKKLPSRRFLTPGATRAALRSCTSFFQAVESLSLTTSEFERESERLSHQKFSSNSTTPGVSSKVQRNLRKTGQILSLTTRRGTPARRSSDSAKATKSPPWTT